MSAPSAYGEALALTKSTLEWRGRWYARLAAVIGLLVFGSLVLALILRTRQTLVGVAGAAGVWAAFLVLDVRAVAGWQRRILELWTAGALEPSVFVEALGRIPTLPRESLAGMVATLRIPLGALPPPGLEVPAREAVAQAARSALARDSARVLLRGGAGVVVVVGAAAAVALRRWEPLLGLLAVPVLIGLGNAVGRPAGPAVPNTGAPLP